MINYFLITFDLKGFKETNEVLTKRFLDDQKRVILDFDSSVNTVYGNQEGAEVGYNSHNQGKSFHPLYVYEGISRLCLYAELRNGKAYTSHGMNDAAIESKTRSTKCIYHSLLR